MAAFETFREDMKQSLRQFAKSPGFTLAAIAALTLGIGVNTAIFSVVNAVLLKPLGFPDPDRVVLLMNTSPDGSGGGSSPAKLQHFAAQTDAVRDVAGLRVGVASYTGGSFPEELAYAQVTADFFRLVGAPVVLGRTFTATEDMPGGGHVVVLSESQWTSRFNRDPQVVGKSIQLNGEPHTIVGVLGGFDFSEFEQSPIQVWMPFQFEPASNNHGHYFQAAGRLAPGVSLAQAQALVAQSAEVFRRKFPDQLAPQGGFSVEPVRDVMVRDAQRTLLVLSGAVGLVLLIACANVANLLLIRANGRRREFAIRASLGASRGRIARQLLGESVMLSLAGGVLGLLLGMIGIRALLAIDTAGLPRIGTNGALVGLDWRVLAYTVAMSLATGVLFGLVPAWHASRSDLTSALKESSGRSGTGFRQNKARSLLVVSEVALALVLLIGSALLIRTAYALSHVDPGFDARNVLTVRTSLSAARFKEPGVVEQTVKEGIERLSAIPGVTAASASFCVPLQGCYGLNFDIVGKPADGQNRGSSWITAAPGYFDVFKIPVKRGRAFTGRDDSHSPGVAIINEAMARQYWPNADPLNDRIWIGQGGMSEFKDEPQRQIIGIVGDTRDGGLNNEPLPTMYTPQAQVPAPVNELNLRLSPFAWMVRTQGDPAALSETIQEQVRQITGQPINGARAMDEVVRRSISRERFNMWLMTLFGGAALLLAAIGIYGLMAYSVQQRTQELGIRQALGADSARLRKMVVRQGMRLTLIGVVIGMAAAFGLARLIAALLFGVGATDPLVFLGVPLLLSAVAFLAVWVPARRASAVDPIEALRYE